jgi:GNAT superfamily N-acetyltransferase
VEITLNRDPSRADIDVVELGLIAANRENSGRDAGYFPFAFHILDDAGKPIGGATGYGSFDWLFVELLHVPKQLQGQGIGTKLMGQIEDFAREHKLLGIWLDTYSFQARPFYEKLGFTVFGTIDNHPIGGHRFFMQKRLDTPSPSA